MKNILKSLGGFAMGLALLVSPVLALEPVHQFALIQPAPIAPPPVHNTTIAQPVSDTTTVQPHVLSPALKTAIQKRVTDAATTNETKDDSNKNGWFKNVFSEYGVQFLALVVSLLGVILAISGFSMASRKKTKHMSTFMNEIDDAFHSFKWKSKRCEAELYRLNDLLEEKLKKGKIDESTFALLTGRIEKYLKEIQELDSLPEHVRKQRAGD